MQFLSIICITHYTQSMCLHCCCFRLCKMAGITGYRVRMGTAMGYILASKHTMSGVLEMLSPDLCGDPRLSSYIAAHLAATEVLSFCSPNTLNDTNDWCMLFLTFTYSGLSLPTQTQEQFLYDLVLNIPKAVITALHCNNEG